MAPTTTIKPEAEGELLTSDDAARYLKVSRITLKRWVALRRIAFVRMGRLTRFQKTALDRYIAKHSTSADDE